MSNALPAWLLEARAEGAPKRRMRQFQDRADLEPGDLWVFASAGDCRVQRVVLVMDVDARAGSVTAALVSTEVDFAGDRDLVLKPEETAAGYPLMVETGFVAILHWSRAEHRVGMLSDDLVDHLVNFVWDDRPDALEDLRGHPWIEPAHAERAAFEVRELEDLIELARTSDQRFGGAPVQPALGFDAASAIVHCRNVGADEYLLRLLDDIDRGAAIHCEYIDDGGYLGGTQPGMTWPSPTNSAVTLSDIRGLMQPLVDRLLTVPNFGVCDLDLGGRGHVKMFFQQGGLPDAIVLVAPHLASRSKRTLLASSKGTLVHLAGLPDD